MFFKRKKAEKDFGRIGGVQQWGDRGVQKSIDDLKQKMTDFMKQMIFCQDCGVVLKKSMAGAVEGFWGTSCQPNTLYFCKTHIPPYNEIIVTDGHTRYFRTGKVEVDEKGVEIKGTDGKSDR